MADITPAELAARLDGLPAVAELIEMLSAGDLEDGCRVFDHTPEEIGLHVMENHAEILAALRSPDHIDRIASRMGAKFVPTMRLTAEEIEAGRTPAGGFRREQLAAWGVPWPPPKGWRKALMEGPAE